MYNWVHTLAVTDNYERENITGNYSGTQKDR